VFAKQTTYHNSQCHHNVIFLELCPWRRSSKDFPGVWQGWRRLHISQWTQRSFIPTWRWRHWRWNTGKKRL